MVPLFMCWVDTGDKIQGKMVLSNLQESTPISMVECIHNYSFFIVPSIFVCNKTLQLQCGQIEPGFVPTLDSLKFLCYPPLSLSLSLSLFLPTLPSLLSRNSKGNRCLHIPIDTAVKFIMHILL